MRLGLGVRLEEGGIRVRFIILRWTICFIRLLSGMYVLHSLPPLLPTDFIRWVVIPHARIRQQQLRRSQRRKFEFICASRSSSLPSLVVDVMLMGEM